jgi:hypothetical protein
MNGSWRPNEKREKFRTGKRESDEFPPIHWQLPRAELDISNRSCSTDNKHTESVANNRWKLFETVLLRQKNSAKARHDRSIAYKRISPN